MSPMPEILHITTRDRWEQAVAEGEYRSDDLATEGFIHCLTSEQLPYVYGKFYKGGTGLVVLRIDSERLKPPLKWENPHEKWKLFPHIYGPINPDAVVEVVPLEDVFAQGTRDDMDHDLTGDFNLKGRVAIITGGGRGIGRAIAIGLASAGASVAVVARSQDQVAETADRIAQAGGRAVAVPADVSDPEAAQRMVREVERALGPADLLVNNAGAAGPIGPTWEVDPGDWWRCLEVNLRGPMLCSRAVLPGMIDRGCGRIINVASGAGTWAIPHLGAYVTSKTALIRFTEILAAEVAEHDVKVFAIEPGTVRTEMAESVLGSEEGRRWLPWLRAIFEQGRDVTPDRAVRLVTLIASGLVDALSGRFFTVADDVLGLAERAVRGELGEDQTLRLATGSEELGERRSTGRATPTSSAWLPANSVGRPG
jgi:NAD(P)-dependent dehydrogenase (short-subunit alcohol dehydrogenase family)/uncharacterized protein (DUF952 family)